MQKMEIEPKKKDVVLSKSIKTFSSTISAMVLTYVCFGYFGVLQSLHNRCHIKSSSLMSEYL
jgi:hypothetical protein